MCAHLRARTKKTPNHANQPIPSQSKLQMTPTEHLRSFTRLHSVSVSRVAGIASVSSSFVCFGLSFDLN